MNQESVGNLAHLAHLHANDHSHLTVHTVEIVEVHLFLHVVTSKHHLRKLSATANTVYHSSRMQLSKTNVSLELASPWNSMGDSGANISPTFGDQLMTIESFDCRGSCPNPCLSSLCVAFL